MYQLPHQLRCGLRLKETTQLCGELPVSSLFSRTRNSALAVKNYAKANVKFFWSHPIFISLFLIISVFISGPVQFLFIYQLQNPIQLRSSHPEVFCKKGVLKNFAKFTGKHLCKRLFFNKVAGSLKKSLWHKCFHVNFAKFLRTHFLQNSFGGCF